MCRFWNTDTRTLVVCPSLPSLLVPNVWVLGYLRTPPRWGSEVCTEWRGYSRQMYWKLFVSAMTSKSLNSRDSEAEWGPFATARAAQPFIHLLCSRIGKDSKRKVSVVTSSRGFNCDSHVVGHSENSQSMFDLFQNKPFEEKRSEFTPCRPRQSWVATWHEVAISSHDTEA